MREYTKLLSVLFASGVIFSAAPSYAIGPGSSVRDLGSHVRNLALTGKKRVSAPFAHVLFCSRQPEDCQSNAFQLVSARDELQELETVNRKVNDSIEPRADDPSILGGDVWSLSPAFGDCEDFALTKRHELLKRGWSSSALRLAQVLTSTGEGHLVLVATTTKGDVVLDNLNSRILPWQKTPYHWRQIQSAEDPRVWLNL